jgi:hypothetical protein
MRKMARIPCDRQNQRLTRINLFHRDGKRPASSLQVLDDLVISAEMSVSKLRKVRTTMVLATDSMGYVRPDTARSSKTNCVLGRNWCQEN